MFESFLLKTRRAELGHWECKDEAFVDSVGRCVELDEHFPGKFVSFKFVSNAAFFDSGNPKEIKKSPVRLKRAIMAAVTLPELPEPFLATLREMAATLEVDL